MGIHNGFRFRFVGPDEWQADWNYTCGHHYPIRYANKEEADKHQQRMENQVCHECMLRKDRERRKKAEEAKVGWFSRILKKLKHISYM